jgi:transketolase
MSALTACKTAFAQAVEELAKQDKRITVLCSDSRGSTGFSGFAHNFPEQFVECGIAEQDEIGIAAGLATVLQKPIVCAPACFFSARSLEQIKVDVAYSGRDVKIFGVSGGISYAPLGLTHYSLHDIAVMRCFTGLDVFLPSDARQTYEMARTIIGNGRPSYIRVGRNPVPEVYHDRNTFVYGKSNQLTEGTDLTIIACGEMVWRALEASRLLKEEGIRARVLDMVCLKPLDEEAIQKAAKETGAILTVEEHHLSGGLGAAVASFVVANLPVVMSILGIPDQHIPTGNPAEIMDALHLNAQGIAQVAKALLVRKNA